MVSVWFIMLRLKGLLEALTKRLPMSLGRVLFPNHFVVSPLNSRFSTISNLDVPPFQPESRKIAAGRLCTQWYITTLLQLFKNLQSFCSYNMHAEQLK